MTDDPATIKFTKMHGCGNDFIIVDTALNHIADPGRAALTWCDRHKGIGADGLVLIGRAPEGANADYTMRIFNADGSEGLMCGNASRCIGRYLRERGYTAASSIDLLTRSGVKRLELTVDADGRVESVAVDMLEPRFEVPSLYRPDLAGDLPEGTFVAMGNPHYVIFVDDVESVDVASVGPRLERHRAFPERCNIEFATITPEGIRLRVWERGSGITLACGTGACATAVAAAATGRSPRRARVLLDGGVLSVDWREADGHVILSGPATFVFDGELPPLNLQQLH